MTTQATTPRRAKPSLEPVEPETAAETPSAPVEEEEKRPDRLLDLVTLAPTRRRVLLPTPAKPNGEQYEIRLLEDFGIGTQQRLNVWARKYDRLLGSDDELNQAEQAELEYALGLLFEEILQAPPEFKADAPDFVKQRVVRAFSLAPQLDQIERTTAELERTTLHLLVRKGYATQEQIDEVVEEARMSMESSTSGS